jgi:hypothetical protein
VSVYRADSLNIARGIQFWHLHSDSLGAIHQGGGLIDAFCAVWTNTTVSTPSLVLNDTVSFRGEQEFTIFNNGTRMVNYILTHRPAVTLQTFSPQTKYGRPDLNPSSSNQSATAQISPQKFSIKPGSSQVVRVNFSPPEKLDPHWLAVYSGFIVMVSSVKMSTRYLLMISVNRLITLVHVLDFRCWVWEPQSPLLRCFGIAQRTVK